MTNIIQIEPNKWVSEDLLITVTGLRPGTIKRARENSWLQGREYLLFSPVDDPKPNSECMYNREAIDKWIEQQSKRQPGTAKLKKSA
ncbi:excisionase family protein [Yersinia bercovieri]|uniref:excisionase family protein n=1 Tax=Yersinia bercovieri TaxID=634 RepID=UPI0011AA4C66|nr:excisionase family protein [Yersinia bercovieri]MDN0101602.1 excisionase family protein [Yersinia bercovieri]